MGGYDEWIAAECLAIGMRVVTGFYDPVGYGGHFRAYCRFHFDQMSLCGLKADKSMAFRTWGNNP